jgi:hypothetical protein
MVSINNDHQVNNDTVFDKGSVLFCRKRIIKFLKLH